MFQPEIVKGDGFYEEIVTAVVRNKPKTILEIGSANGLGSTQALIEGSKVAGLDDVLIYCLEPDQSRYLESVRNLSSGRKKGQTHHTVINKNLIVFHGKSTCGWEGMEASDIAHFLNFRGYGTKTAIYPLETVLRWLKDEKDMLRQNKFSYFQWQGRMKNPEMVLLDGSPFAGFSDYIRTKGAKVLILDDINDIKNLDAYADIRRGKEYKIVSENWNYRNGCAICEKCKQFGS